MEFGQILQVVMSLGVVALALYLSARLARRRLGPGSDEALVYRLFWWPVGVAFSRAGDAA